MEQTVHTNTDLNGKLTATQLRQVFHWILYRSERRLSEWWRHRLSRWCQLCGWCVCVCVLCERVCVCVWSGAGCPRIVAHSVPHPRLWMYSSGRRDVSKTMQDVSWAADVFHTCTGVTWSRDITRTHTRRDSTTNTTNANYKDLDLHAQHSCLFFSFFFSSRFFFFYSPFDQDISASDKKGNPLLFFFFTEAASPPLEVKLGSATRQPHRVWRWRGVDLESCVRIGLRDVRVVSRQRWCQPGFDCEGRDRRWGNRRSPKYCFLFLFLSLL